MNLLKWTLASCVVALVLVGCGQKRAVVVADRSPHASEPVIATGDIEPRLRAEVSRWHGTPHRMGGTGFSGVDCSGLVQRIYRDLFGIQVPRTARQQAAQGVGVGRHALKPGDLVFFRPPGKKDHVGIYLGKGEFVHTSAKKGVTISRMDSNYWRNYYWKSRRILR